MTRSVSIDQTAPIGDSRPASDSPATFRQAARVFFSHKSPLQLVTLAVLTLGGRLWVGEFSTMELLGPLLLLLLWPFLEWWIHSVMLHYQPVTLRGRKIDFLLPQTHRAHHRDPWNLKLVFIPKHIFPLVTPLIAITLYLLLPLSLALTTFFTLMLFALHYEWCHYLAHIRYCPDTEYYRRRVREHRMHHFLHEQRWWGVSTGFADRLFRTAPERSTVSRTETTRTLGQPTPGNRAYSLMGVSRPTHS